MQTIKWSEIDPSFCQDKAQREVYVCKNCEGTIEQFSERTTKTHVVNATFRGENVNGLYRRLSENIEQSHFLFYDFDNGEDIPFLIKTFMRLNCAIIATTSKNHMKDKGDGKGIIPRLHVHIPINPINGTGDKTTAEFMSFCWKRIVEELKLDCADTNAMDGVRKFTPGRVSKVYDGPLLDIRRFKDDFQVYLENEAAKKMQMEIGMILHRKESFDTASFINGYVRKNKLDFKIPDSDRMIQLCRLVGACKSVCADINILKNWIDRNSNYNNNKDAAFNRRKVQKTIETLWRKK
jgi:hypothetical protein